MSFGAIASDLNPAEVIEDTWGHLKPGNKTYTGYILAANGCYGDVVIITNDFEGLPNSPWQFEAFQT